MRESARATRRSRSALIRRSGKGIALIEMTKIVLITGPAGVGKSTLNWEVSAQLAAAGLRHAAIETDELDRIFPIPRASELEALRPGMTDVSEINSPRYGETIEPWVVIA
jgi:Mrp family chromosome partitioning ATPase